MMKAFVISVLIASVLASPAHAAACAPGAYESSTGELLVITSPPQLQPPGQRYMFLDGRRGRTDDSDSPVVCNGTNVATRPTIRAATWKAVEITRTPSEFVSYGTLLKGELVEPSYAGRKRPLVVMIHGSEHTPAIGSERALLLAAQGLSVFTYDKRGTGASEGEYTQNFELLADDAAAAMNQAKKLASGRYSRAGFYGVSQGGWVAPLAATRSNVDFVAVGFGLVASPIEEDRDQMLQEASAAGLGENEIKLIYQLSAATARLMTSHFQDGYEDLASVKHEMASKPWALKINGEYSGDILRTDEDDLRRIGRARFDNLELISDYDAVSTLKKLRPPLLWVLAGEDREAPIEGTRRVLSTMIAEGKPIDLYLFPGTDHGMYEFVLEPDGTRRNTRITDGYYRLMADWIKGKVSGPYGRGVRLSGGEN